jgi:hypothetical protein
MCSSTSTAKASKPHSQHARKYGENSGIALVMKSAPTNHAGSVSSLPVSCNTPSLVSAAALALAHDATLTPFITAMLLCAIGALIAFVVATRLTAETATPFDGSTVQYP